MKVPSVLLALLLKIGTCAAKGIWPGTPWGDPCRDGTVIIPMGGPGPTFPDQWPCEHHGGLLVGGAPSDNPPVELDCNRQKCMLHSVPGEDPKPLVLPFESADVCSGAYIQGFPLLKPGGVTRDNMGIAHNVLLDYILFKGIARDKKALPHLIAKHVPKDKKAMRKNMKKLVKKQMQLQGQDVAAFLAFWKRQALEAAKEDQAKKAEVEVVYGFLGWAVDSVKDVTDLDVANDWVVKWKDEMRRLGMENEVRDKMEACTRVFTSSMAYWQGRAARGEGGGEGAVSRVAPWLVDYVVTAAVDYLTGDGDIATAIGSAASALYKKYI